MAKAKPAPKAASKKPAAKTVKVPAKAPAKAASKSGPKPSGKARVASAKSLVKPRLKTKAPPKAPTKSALVKPVASKAENKSAAPKASTSKTAAKGASLVASVGKVALKMGKAVAQALATTPKETAPKRGASAADKKAKKPTPKTVGKMSEPDIEEDDFVDDSDERDADVDAALEEEEAATDSTDEEAPVEAAAEKAPEKKKKKDDLKIDRNGDLESQWQSLHDKNKGLKAVPYKMSDNFEAKTPLMHKVLGWGYVISSVNNRLEVLFKDGIKILIANYKA